MGRGRSKVRGNSGPSRLPPLPGAGDIKTYDGRFINYAVWVTERAQMIDLYRYGFFGKGMLSRSRPEWGTGAALQSRRPRERKKLKRTSGFHVVSIVSQPEVQKEIAAEVAEMKKRRSAQQAQAKKRARVGDAEEIEVAAATAAASSTSAPPAAAAAASSSSVAERNDDNDNDDDDDGQIDDDHSDEALDAEAAVGSQERMDEQPAVAASAAEQQGDADGAAAAADSAPAVGFLDDFDEALQLTLEEAFFLTWALGCLQIYTNEDNKTPLSAQQCWTLFCQAQPNFLYTYTAYHFYRSNCWCVKSGIKYGTEFVLYRTGPALVHAEHAVMVLPALASTKTVIREDRRLLWRTLFNLNRVAQQVAKDLVLCYVLQPDDMSAEEKQTPDCVKRMTVQELNIRRWVPDRMKS